MIIIALVLKTLMVQTSRVSPSLDNFLIASHRPPRLRQSPKWVVMPSTAMSVTQLKSLFQNYVIVFHCSFIIIAMTVSRISLNINSLRDNNNRMANLQWISHLSLGLVCIMEN